MANEILILSTVSTSHNIEILDNSVNLLIEVSRKAFQYLESRSIYIQL